MNDLASALLRGTLLTMFGHAFYVLAGAVILVAAFAFARQFFIAWRRRT